MKHKIILDCDPGHDDAIAILLAARHPEIELVAITTVAGNQSVDKTTHNALKVCSLAKIRSIPIARGAEQPLVRTSKYAENIHGELGLGGSVIPEPDIKPVSMHAVHLIIDLLMNSESDITVVPTGPLTNIATAIRIQPAIIPKIKAISLIGGAIGLGNVTPAAEFNIHFDPEAAAIVFSSGCPITMVPLEVTHQALATEDIVRRLRVSGRTVANFAADLLVSFANAYRQVFGLEAPPVHDPCVVATVIDPDIIQAKMMRVEIEMAGQWSSGQTICDVYGTMHKSPNARVGYELNAPRFWDMLIETLLMYE